MQNGQNVRGLTGRSISLGSFPTTITAFFHTSKPFGCSLLKAVVPKLLLPKLHAKSAWLKDHPQTLCTFQAMEATSGFCVLILLSPVKAIHNFLLIFKVNYRTN